MSFTIFNSSNNGVGQITSTAVVTSSGAATVPVTVTLAKTGIVKNMLVKMAQTTSSSVAALLSLPAGTVHQSFLPINTINILPIIVLNNNTVNTVGCLSIAADGSVLIGPAPTLLTLFTASTFIGLGINDDGVSISYI